MTPVRVQVAHPSEHASIADLPFREPLDEWDMSNVHRVLGLHRHVVKLIEFDDASYVVKELPDELAMREYRLLRQIADDGLPTAEMVAVITDRDVGDGMIVTRHLDYSLPYRSLLQGRGLQIPYLGDRLLDALVVLLVRIHLAGFYWGDCSLSNTLFRRDAGALQAYIIDVETAERHATLTRGQRGLDIMIATDNVAGGLLDLQAAGRLADDIDPIPFAEAIEGRYDALWSELTAESTATIGDVLPMRHRLDRLHELGFDVDEMELVTTEDGSSVRYVPKVVEHGHHAERLASLTGLTAGENQARRMLDDIGSYAAWLQSQSERPIPFNVAAVRWLDRVFEPVIGAIPPELLNRLEPAEIFHQLLEHRWYMTERLGHDVTLFDVLDDYRGVLARAPDERLQLGEAAEGGDIDGGEIERDDIERDDIEGGDIERDDIDDGDIERDDIERDDIERDDIERDDIDDGDIDDGDVDGDDTEGGDIGHDVDGGDDPALRTRA
jgi:tRNA A-37 threonylcarbamoyl transferase component Bud32